MKIKIVLNVLYNSFNLIVIAVAKDQESAFLLFDAIEENRSNFHELTVLDLSCISFDSLL